MTLFNKIVSYSTVHKKTQIFALILCACIKIKNLKILLSFKACYHMSVDKARKKALKKYLTKSAHQIINCISFSITFFFFGRHSIFKFDHKISSMTSLFISTLLNSTHATEISKIIVNLFFMRKSFYQA